MKAASAPGAATRRGMTQNVKTVATAVLALLSMVALLFTPLTATAAGKSGKGSTASISVINVAAPNATVLEASWQAPDSSKLYSYSGYIRKAGEGDVPRVRPGTSSTSRQFHEDSLGRPIEPDTVYEVAIDALELSSAITERLPRTTWVQVRTPAQETTPADTSEPLRAIIDIAATEVIAGDTFVLDGSKSAGAVRYEWDDAINDAPLGRWPMGEGEVLEFTWETPGLKIPRLTVTDERGDQAQAMVEVTVVTASSEPTPSPEPEPEPEPKPEPKPDPEPEPEPTAASESEPELETLSSWSNSYIGTRTWYQANTGPRNLEESKLKVYSGRLNLTEDNQVLENVRVDGPLHVVGDGITVRNAVVNGTLNLRESKGALIEDVIVRSGAPYPVNAGSASNWTLQYAEIDGQKSTKNNGGLWGGDGIVRHSEFHSHTDSAKVGSNSVWEYNWLHSNGKWGTDAHVDGLQSMGASNVVVRRNFIDMPIANGANSAIIAQSNFGPLTDWTIAENYLNGGNYTLFIRGKDHGEPDNIIIRNNRIGRDYRYGPISRDGNVTTTGNVWHDTNEPAL